MRTLRATLALAVVLGSVLLAAPPARAGGWAATLLDPLPERVEAGVPYTIGFWVLQHGSHPYWGGKLEPVGLKLVGADGTVVKAPGVPLKEPAHYATALVIPRSGTWSVYGVQGVFQDYQVGTLTVPGKLSVLPLPPVAPVGAKDHQPWGAVRPPQLSVDPNRHPFAEPALAQEKPAAVAPRVQRTDDHAPWLAPGALVVAVLVGGLALALSRRRWPGWMARAKRRFPRETGPRRDLIG